MKEVIEKYYCDVCGKEVSEDFLFKTTVPVREWDCEGKKCKMITKTLDLCADCVAGFYRVNLKYFAEIDECYGIRSKVKYKEVQEDE